MSLEACILSPVAAAPANLRERRARKRRPCQVPINCRPALPWNAAEYWPATIVNRSASGLGLAVGRPFPRGTLLVAELQEPTTHPAQVVLARVVRADRQAEGHWIVGCTLDVNLDREELQAILGSS